MADVDDRWMRDARDPETGKPILGADGKPLRERTDRYGTGLRYAARWRDDQRQQRTKSFGTVRDAKAWLSKVDVDLSTGGYVDPKGGRLLLRDYATPWLARQAVDASSRERMESRIRLHIEQTLGGVQLRAVTPSRVQALARALQDTLSPSSVGDVLTTLGAILGDAVEDRLIATNPVRSKSVRRPTVPERQVVPWPAEWVEGVRAELPARFAEMVTAGAGIGLRQGEMLGLAVEDIDWLRGVVHVRRQVKKVGYRRVFAPPKRNKTRDVPLAPSVRDRLAAHLKAFPAVEVTLPWRTPDGPPVTAHLLFTTTAGNAIDRNYISARVWRPALRKVGIPDTRDHGQHCLRHRFASVVLDGGASVRELAEWLGHANATITLGVYSHLMPSGTARMATAIDAAFQTGGAPDVRQARD